MAKQLSKITIRLLSVSIVLTIVGIDHNVSDIEAALAVRTIIAEQQVSKGDCGAVMVNNLLFDYAVGNDETGCHIVLRSRAKHSVQKQDYNNQYFALVAAGNQLICPDKNRGKYIFTSQNSFDCFAGQNQRLRAGPVCA